MISLYSQRCPRCGNRTRSKVRCRSCGYKLLFLKSAISEQEWKDAVERVSSKNSYYYTPKQLFAEFLYEYFPQYPLFRTILLCLLIALYITTSVEITLGVGVVAIVAYLLPSETRLYTLGLILICPLVVSLLYSLRVESLFFLPSLLLATYSLRYAPPPKLSFDEFEVLLYKWLEGNRQNKLLLRKRLDKSPKNLSFEELSSFGYRAILVTDQDELVDFFILNRFVFEIPFLVVSHNFYPKHISEHLARKVPVFYLHGSAFDKEYLQERLQKKRTPYSEILDIGWSEALLKKHPNFRRFDDLGNIPVDLLSPIELLDSVAYAIRNQTSILSYFGEPE